MATVCLYVQSCTGADQILICLQLDAIDTILQIDYDADLQNPPNSVGVDCERFKTWPYTKC
jgi:hypothetical protein